MMLLKTYTFHILSSNKFSDWLIGQVADDSPSVWPDLARFRHFGKSLQVFGKFLTVYFLFGKILSLLWPIRDIIGLIFIAANGQI